MSWVDLGWSLLYSDTGLVRCWEILSGSWSILLREGIRVGIGTRWRDGDGTYPRANQLKYLGTALLLFIALFGLYGTFSKRYWQAGPSSQFRARHSFSLYIARIWFFAMAVGAIYAEFKNLR